MTNVPSCDIPNCSNPTASRGWCNSHYLKWRKYGDPLASRRVGRPPICEIVDGAKICSGCGEMKQLAEFAKAKTGADGHRGNCKLCVRARHRQRYSATPLEERQERAKKTYRDPSRRAWVASYQENNKDRIQIWRAQWYLDNVELVRQWGRDRNRRLRATVRGRLESNISRRLQKSLRERKVSKLGHRTEAILGYTADELILHIERQFLPGMCWENYGFDGWHIDHIIPLARFQYSSIEDADFKSAWGLNNLRPLWAAENMAKGAKRLHLI